jgi:hypothetical protein
MKVGATIRLIDDRDRKLSSYEKDSYNGLIISNVDGSEGSQSAAEFHRFELE